MKILNTLFKKIRPAINKKPTHLYDLKIGQKAKITEFNDKTSVITLGRMGIMPGAVVKILKKGMFDGPLLIQKKGGHPVAYRKEALNNVKFEIIC